MAAEFYLYSYLDTHELTCLYLCSHGVQRMLHQYIAQCHYHHVYRATIPQWIIHHHERRLLHDKARSLTVRRLGYAWFLRSKFVVTFLRLNASSLQDICLDEQECALLWYAEALTSVMTTPFAALESVRLKWAMASSKFDALLNASDLGSQCPRLTTWESTAMLSTTLPTTLTRLSIDSMLMRSDDRDDWDSFKTAVTSLSRLESLSIGSPESYSRHQGMDYKSYDSLCGIKYFRDMDKVVASSLWSSTLTSLSFEMKYTGGGRVFSEGERLVDYSAHVWHLPQLRRFDLLVDTYFRLPIVPPRLVAPNLNHLNYRSTYVTASHRQHLSKWYPRLGIYEAANVDDSNRQPLTLATTTTTTSHQPMKMRITWSSRLAPTAEFAKVQHLQLHLTASTSDKDFFTYRIVRYLQYCSGSLETFSCHCVYYPRLYYPRPGNAYEGFPSTDDDGDYKEAVLLSSSSDHGLTTTTTTTMRRLQRMCINHCIIKKATILSHPYDKDNYYDKGCSIPSGDGHGGWRSAFACNDDDDATSDLRRDYNQDVDTSHTWQQCAGFCMGMVPEEDTGNRGSWKRHPLNLAILTKFLAFPQLTSFAARLKCANTSPDWIHLFAQHFPRLHQVAVYCCKRRRDSSTNALCKCRIPSPTFACSKVPRASIKNKKGKQTAKTIVTAAKTASRRPTKKGQGEVSIDEKSMTMQWTNVTLHMDSGNNWLRLLTWSSSSIHTLALQRHSAYLFQTPLTPYPLTTTMLARLSELLPRLQHLYLLFSIFEREWALIRAIVDDGYSSAAVVTTTGMLINNKRPLFPRLSTLWIPHPQSHINWRCPCRDRARIGIHSLELYSPFD